MSEYFPKARLAMDSADLDITNVKYDLNSNKKWISTMRGGKGFTKGNEDTGLSFDMVIGEDGEEADWIKLVQGAFKKQVRLKVPGRTVTINGTFTSYSLDNSSDSEIKITLNMIGNTEV